jgi:hypothetical protein
VGEGTAYTLSRLMSSTPTSTSTRSPGSPADTWPRRHVREGRAVLPDYIGELAVGESRIVRRQADGVVDG